MSEPQVHRCGCPITPENTRWNTDGHGRRYKTCRACAKAKLIARKKTAKLFLFSVRARTSCAACGNQPIEWHRKEHEGNPSRRVSVLACGGMPIKTIEAEIAQCTPLCRRCHMKHDGLMQIAIHNVRNSPRPSGEKHPNATLSAQQVESIRKRYELGEKQAEIAKLFKVTLLRGGEWFDVASVERGSVDYSSMLKGKQQLQEWEAFAFQRG